MKKHLLILLLFVNVWANPVITGYVGTPDSGQALTIKGIGLGVKANPGPLKFKDFEDGTNGVDLATVDSDWDTYNGTLNHLNTIAHSGALSVGAHATNGEVFEAKYFMLPQYDKIFISYWYNTIGADGNDHTVVKLPRISSSEAAGGGGVYNGRGSTTLGGQYDFMYGIGPYCSYDNGDGVESIIGYLTMPPLNQWVKVEMYKKLSTAGETDGHIFVNLVGVDRAEDSTAMTRRANETFQLDAVLIGIMDGCECNHDYYGFLDDVYIDTTCMRVELGNRKNYYDCTTLEIQTATAWNDSININLKYRSSDFDSLYLFVIDEDNRISEGYRLQGTQNGELATGKYLSIYTPTSNAGTLTWDLTTNRKCKITVLKNSTPIDTVDDVDGNTQIETIGSGHYSFITETLR